jgi:hypothetical protein
MRRFAVVTAVLALSMLGVDAAAAATTTVEGTYAGGTTPLARPALPPDDCIDFGAGSFTGNPCLFEGTGIMTGTDQNDDPWEAGYQAHLQWAPAPVGQCAPISGEIGFAPSWTDPENPPPGGFLRVIVDSSTSEACTTATGFFTSTFTVHIDGPIDGVGVGPFEDATGTFTRDGTLTFNQVVPGTDEGTFSLSYSVPDPLPTSADQCKKDGWESYGIFTNQGDCVSFVATHGKNEPGQNLP